MTDVILIPYRGVNAARERNLQAVLRWYEPLGLTVTLGDSGSEKFNRGASRNAAAAGAGDWDRALIADADCVAQLGVVRRAFDLASETGKLILPHDNFWRFTEVGTKRFVKAMEFYRDQPSKAIRLTAEKTVINRSWMPSGALVLTRETFERIGRYQEGFEGWGYEDSTFYNEAKAIVGVVRMPGLLWHLFHPRDQGTVEERTKDRALAHELWLARRAAKGYDQSTTEEGPP